MTDENKETVSLESFNELKGQIDSLVEAVKGFQKLNDGFKKEIKALKAPKVTASAEEQVYDDPTQQMLADIRKQNKELLADKAERITREKDTKFTESVRKLLLDNGTNAKFVDHAVIYAKNAGVVRADENGNVVFKVDGMDYEDARLGAKEWAQTDEAKLYLTPRNSKGSGQKTENTQKDSDSGSNKGPKPKFSMEELEIQAREALLGGF
jgi:hypothetical protein